MVILVGRVFDFEPALVFHEKGGLITDLALIADNDVVYVADKDDVATDTPGERAAAAAHSPVRS